MGQEREASRLVEQARTAVASEGWYLMEPDAVAGCLGIGVGEFGCLASHWEELAVDPYAAERGTRRMRRYGSYELSANGTVRAKGHETFVQPQNSNPLYVDRARRFEPLTEKFCAEPALDALIRLLGQVARGLDGTPEWEVKVHPFRVAAQTSGDGEPAPEGRHKDGVTLVSSLLIGRENVDGGRSTLYGPNGKETAAVTLSAPGSLLLSDDRATWHDVSPIRPLDPARPAHRDVLVTTLLAQHPQPAGR
ncbi:2OG-Fe dioxygenase family protein [Streptomyces sp. NBC_00525]|uniref:2OG-Fe dioxygenase family protein n=1 Tax=Streptomyces sp. NBC_00525 TaxID=2903660 RepID=UPI002E81DB21|nr:2OG-Fe dioxygenase family protein [Streptomyces sp. NBC_00525]WUC92145.1 2OG-Fe dioxygenase family protein [Streptomyces sp. NBC_00525]